MQLRNSLSEQLQKPMRFNDHTVTGPLLAQLTPVLVDALNDPDEKPISPHFVFEEMQRRRAELGVKAITSQMHTFVESITVSHMLHLKIPTISSEIPTIYRVKILNVPCFALPTILPVVQASRSSCNSCRAISRHPPSPPDDHYRGTTHIRTSGRAMLTRPGPGSHNRDPFRSLTYLAVRRKGLRRKYHRNSIEANSVAQFALGCNKDNGGRSRNFEYKFLF
jgi:hypothetical protein